MTPCVERLTELERPESPPIFDNLICFPFDNVFSGLSCMLAECMPEAYLEVVAIHEHEYPLQISPDVILNRTSFVPARVALLSGFRLKKGRT